ncbi:hypothetical protein GCM10023209_20120 [Roseibacterium beibuensis]|uniref:Uncharacterized protein n=2 Tax=[Roseibacterium] beibuensis TaxID=1193142 RepID=A0ABP9LDF1_9RHOB
MPGLVGTNMPQLLPGAVFFGILAVVAVIVLRARAAKPRLSVFRLALIGVAAAYVIPPSLAFLMGQWAAVSWLPGPPTVTGDQVFIAALVSVFALALQQPGKPPSVPLWAGILIGVAVAAFLPPLLDLATGRYQNASLRADVTHCTRGMTGQVQPREVSNLCDFDIVVGLCMPGEVNPTPCAQAFTIPPGESAVFDPGDARLSSVPGNPNGLTVVACRPPDRPSRWGNVTGRGYRGVCLPPG